MRWQHGQWGGGRTHVGQRSPRAERVLAERFACGEIDEQEYVRCRDLL
jgi:uncharacterized membrane protein